MTSGVDTDKAWEEFVEERSFQKATSIQGQLDTITSMLSEIKTDTERAAAQAEASAMEPAPSVPMDMAGAEDMAPPEDMGELEDVPEGTAPEDSGMPMNNEIDDTMPPAGVPEETEEDFPPMEPEPLDAPEEVIAEETEAEDVGGGTPVESDLIGQIKVMIANTTDNEQLKGLSNLLSTALSQNQPASPMQGAATAEMNQTSLVKSADGKDEEKEEVEVEEKDDDGEKKEEVKEKSEEKDDDSGDDVSIEVSEEPVPEESEPAPEASIGQDVAAAVADVVEEIVDAALEQPDAVVEMAEEVKEPSTEDISEETETFETSEPEPEPPMMKSFAEMFAAKVRYGIDGQPAIVKAEVGAQYESPAEDDKAPQDVPDGSQEQSEDEDIIVAINGESIGKSAAPSFEEMFNNRDAMVNFLKADVGQPKDADSLRSEGEMPSGDVSVPKDADSALEDGEMPTGDISVPKDADSLRKGCGGEDEEDDFKKTESVPMSEASEEQKKLFENKGHIKGPTNNMDPSQAKALDDLKQTPAELVDTKKSAGIHIRSFAEMYNDSFTKSAVSVDTSRSSSSAVGGTIDRPDISVIKKSEDAERTPLRIGFGVDPHEAVKADWEKFYALRDRGL